MKRPVRILLTMVAVIAVIVCIFCILFIVQYVRGKSVSDKLGSGVRSGQVVEPLDPQDDGKYMAINVDFDSLHDVNPEIYAWIEVPGTNINYAVVQSAADDLFYDDHGVDRSYYSGGSIFSQRYNTTTFQDPVTVLYGHNRQSQTMFAQVNNFADAAFFAKTRRSSFTPRTRCMNTPSSPPIPTPASICCCATTSRTPSSSPTTSPPWGRPSTPTTAGSCFPRPGTRC